MSGRTASVSAYSGMPGRRLLIVGAVVVLLSLLLAGCASKPDPKAYVGKTMADAYRDFGSPNVEDLTTPITGQPTDPDNPPPPAGWLIVAGCTDPQGYVYLGILPVSLATPDIRAEAKNGAYDKYVSACPAATYSPQATPGP